LRYSAPVTSKKSPVRRGRGTPLTKQRKKQPKKQGGTRRTAPFPQTNLGPWEVEAAQIQARAEGVDEIVRRLLRSTESVLSVAAGPNPHVPDGGVDFAVEGPVPGFADCTMSDWHVTGKQLPDAKALRKWVTEQLGGDSVRQGAAQVMVVSNCGITGHKERLRTIEREKRVRILDAEQLAAWVNTVPAIALSIREGPNDGKWLEAALQGHKTEFLWDETREAFLKHFEEGARADRTSFHLEGFAGIGKTRLALEVLRSAQSGRLENQVVYFPSLEKSSIRSLVTYLQSSPARRHAFIVVDECSSTERAICNEDVKALFPRVRLLTIGRASESTRDPDVRAVDPLDQGHMRSFVSARVSDPQLVELLLKECRGYIKAADLLADLAQKTQLTSVAAARMVGERELFANALGDDAAIMQALALLDELEWETPEEIGVFIKHFEFTRTRLREACKRAADRGLFQPSGSRRYLSPHVLANNLALRCVGIHQSDLVDLFRELPHRARMAMLRRLVPLASGDDRDAGTQRLLVQILSELPPPGGGGIASYGDAARTEELRSSLAKALPTETLASIEPTLLSMSEAELKALYRRPIVESLEEAARENALFCNIAQITLRLAATETEPYSNNATGLWSDLFGFGIARTGISNAERLSVLETTSQSNRVVERSLAVAGLGRILSLENGSIFAHEAHHVQSRETDFAEAQLVFARAFPTLVRLSTADSDDGVREVARIELLHAIRIGLKRAPETVVAALPALNESRDRETRRKARLELEWVLAAPSDWHVSSQLELVLRDWVTRMAAIEFPDRLHSWLDDWRTFDSNAEQAIEQECRALATEVLLNPALINDEIDWLVRRVPAPAYGYAFWLQVGRLDARMHFLELFVREARRGHGGYAFGGYARGCAEAGTGEAVEAELDRLAVAQSPSTDVALEVTWRMRASERGLARISDLIQRRSLVGPVPETVAHWAMELPSASVLRVVHWARKFELPMLAYGLTGAFQFWAKKHPDEESAIRQISEQILGLLPVLLEHHRGGGALYFWREYAKKTTQPVNVAAVILDALKGSRGLNETDELAGVLVHLALRERELWPQVGAFLIGNGRARFAVSRTFSPSEAFVEEVLVPWAVQHEHGPLLLAGLAPLSGHLSSLALRVLEVFGSEERVAAELSRRHLLPLNERAGEVFLRERKAEVEIWMKGSSKNVRAWCTRQLLTIDALLRSSRAA